MLANAEIEVVPGVYAIPGLPAVRVGSGYVVVADLHLGYEEALAKDGVYLPRVQLRNAVRTLRSIADASSSAHKLIIAGDVKHVFNKLLRSEREEVSRFLNEAQSLFKEVIVIRGNHDNYIPPIVKAEGVEFLEDDIVIDDIIIIHGHKKPRVRGETVILGHEHPSIQVRVGGSRVKFPVILKVPLESGGNAVVLPAMGTYQTGNVVSTVRSSYLSPLIREEGIVEHAIPYIIEESGGVMELTRLEILEQVLG